MKNNKKAGISLVALVVTIIVLIILTAAVIVTFMEGGIVDRAKEAVFKSDIRTYQEILMVKNAENQIENAVGTGGEELNASTLAEIQEIIPEFKEEYDGLIAISNGEIVLGGVEKDPYTEWLADLGIGLAIGEDEKGIVHNGIIPEGGKYYQGVQPSNGNQIVVGVHTGATEYNAGDKFPELQDGDIYVYGGYEYGYNLMHDNGDSYSWNPIEQNGWSAVYESRAEEPGEILTTINGKNIVSLCDAFRNKDIITAPKIPSTVIDMSSTFAECTSLLKAPVIPSAVIYMSSAFNECTSLTGIIEINANPTKYSSVLSNTQIVKITGLISDDLRTKIMIDSGIPFYYDIDTLPENLTDGIGCITEDYKYIYDESIDGWRVEAIDKTKTEYGEILTTINGKNVVSLEYAFSNCNNLVTAPVIPDTITNMSGAFWCCTSLTGSVEINANPTSYWGAFSNTNITEITGTTTLKDELLATINDYE